MKMPSKWKLAGIVLLIPAGTVLAQGNQKEPSKDPPSRAVAEAQKERATNPAEEGFRFNGGGPWDFVRAVEKHFDVDWSSIATIPKEMERVRVPRIRVETGNPEHMLKLYNRLGDANPVLGKWHWEGDPAKPDVLILIGRGDAAASGRPEASPAILKVFSLRNIPESKFDDVVAFIDRARQIADEAAVRAGAEPLQGRLVLDRRTNSLVATGTKEFLDLVESALGPFRGIGVFGPRSGPGRSGQGPAPEPRSDRQSAAPDEP